MREVFRRVFGVRQDEDFMQHRSATLQQVHDFTNGNGEGPNRDDLHFDMVGPVGNAWNQRVARIVVENFNDYRLSLPQPLRVEHRPDEYLERLVYEKLAQCRRYWNMARPQRTSDGTMETVENVQARIRDDRTKLLHRQRHLSRRLGVRVLLQ
jgi:hypothetical protein